MSILCDIGGTYARFAKANDGNLLHIQKYKAEDFESLREALPHYCNEHDIHPGGLLRIATAGYEDAGVWRFVNKNKWEIDPKALKDAGWEIETILNDFEALVRSIDHLAPDELNIIKDAAGASKTKCVLGPGTGLGLGYRHDTPNGAFIQKTHGGHIAAAALGEEHTMIIQTIQRLKTDQTLCVYENLISGPGLYNIYAAQCLIAGKIRAADTPEDILQYTDTPEVQTSLRLFHEFFGIFAASVVVSGHAYGGLYLTGGVLERLIEHKLFDVEHFERFFTLDAVGSVQRDLNATPIMHITHPYPALKGLLYA